MSGQLRWRAEMFAVLPYKESDRRAWLGRHPGGGSLDSLHMLHEDLLDQPVRLLYVHIMLALSDISNLAEPGVAEDLAGLTESLESVLRLPGHDDVTYQPQEIALAGGIGEISRS